MTGDELVALRGAVRAWAVVLVLAAFVIVRTVSAIPTYTPPNADLPGAGVFVPVLPEAHPSTPRYRDGDG